MRRVFAVFIALLFILALAPAAAAIDGELLYNGDFSVSSELQDLPAGWYLDAWISEGSEAYMQEEPDGSTSVVLENLQENDARICQRVEVEPDTCYRLSCDIYAQGVFGGTGATISVLDTFSSSEQFFDTDGYQHAELVGVTGHDQTELVLALRIGGYGSLSSGQAGFQNVSMTVEQNTPADAMSFEALEYDGGGTSDEQETEETPNWAVLLLAVALSGFAFAYAYQRGYSRLRTAACRRCGKQIAYTRADERRIACARVAIPPVCRAFHGYRMLFGLVGRHGPIRPCGILHKKFVCRLPAGVHVRAVAVRYPAPVTGGLITAARSTYSS